MARDSPPCRYDDGAGDTSVTPTHTTRFRSFRIKETMLKNTIGNRGARRQRPIAVTAGLAALLSLHAVGGERAAWAECTVGTKTPPACTLSVPSP